MTADADRTVGSWYRAIVRVASGLASALGFLLTTSLVADVEGAANPVPAAKLSFRVIADGIPEPLAGESGDMARGRALLVARDPANCALCHALPDDAVRFSGDLGPSLAGVGTRLSAPQIRLRVADNLRLNPLTIMPSYYKVDGLVLVASQYRGKPILTAREIEDVVAYLATLR